MFRIKLRRFEFISRFSKNFNKEFDRGGGQNQLLVENAIKKITSKNGLGKITTVNTIYAHAGIRASPSWTVSRLKSLLVGRVTGKVG